MDGELEQRFRGTAGCRRMVYNLGLELEKEAIAELGHRLGYTIVASFLPFWKEKYPFLKDVPSQCLQQALRDLEVAFKRFYQGVSKFPVFKKFRGKASFRFPDGVVIENRRIWLPKFGYVGFFKSEEIEGKIKSVTVVRDVDRWKAKILTERPDTVKPVRARTEVGADLGVKKLATLSDGTVVPSVSPDAAIVCKLKAAQRTLSKKEKGSNNFEKQRILLGRINRKIRDTREDKLHKATTGMAKDFSHIVLEDLNTKEMMQSASRSLNRSIGEQAWGKFIGYLKYKAARLGGIVIFVNPAGTSQTCHRCRVRDRKSRISQAVFSCVACGWTGDADYNAACNILAAGHAVFCGGTCELESRRSRDQEKPVRVSLEV